MTEVPDEVDPTSERGQAPLRALAAAFSEYGSWKVTHVEATGMSHTEHVSPGQMASIAFNALNDGSHLR